MTLTLGIAYDGFLHFCYGRLYGWQDHNGEVFTNRMSDDDEAQRVWSVMQGLTCEKCEREDVPVSQNLEELYYIGSAPWLCDDCHQNRSERAYERMQHDFHSGATSTIAQQCAEAWEKKHESGR